MSDADFQAHLAALRERFKERLREQRERLRRLRNEPRAPECLSALKHIAHDLSGAAGTFGFPAISDRANALESVLDALPAGGQGDPTDALDDLLAVIDHSL